MVSTPNALVFILRVSLNVTFLKFRAKLSHDWFRLPLIQKEPTFPSQWIDEYVNPFIHFHHLNWN